MSTRITYVGCSTNLAIAGNDVLLYNFKKPTGTVMFLQ